MAANDFDIRYTAGLARLRLTDDEIARYSRQLGDILAYVEKLGELDVDTIEPTAHAVPVFDVMREDAVRPGLTVEDALANAPQKAHGQFVVTKVVE